MIVIFSIHILIGTKMKFNVKGRDQKPHHILKLEPECQNGAWHI